MAWRAASLTHWCHRPVLAVRPHSVVRRFCSGRRPQRVVTRLQRQAFDILNLDTSATLIEIKARYKELVKRFHPDANGGDRGAEERLKQVIKAYGVLRASGLT